MKTAITFTCGPETCASEPGKFCRFMTILGPVGREDGICNVFKLGLGHNKNGEIQRCPQCLKECGREP